MKKFLLPLATVLIASTLVASHASGQGVFELFEAEIAPGSTVTSFSPDGLSSEVIEISGVFTVGILPTAAPNLGLVDIDLSAETDPTFIEAFLEEQIFSLIGGPALTDGTYQAFIDSGVADPLLLTLAPQGGGGPNTTVELTGGFDLTASGEGGLIFDVSAVSVVPEPSGTALLADYLPC